MTAAHNRARADGGELRVVPPAGGTVPRVFALTGIDRYIPCFASLEEALAHPPRRADMQPTAAVSPATDSDARARSTR